MNLLRSGWSTVRNAACLGCLVVSAMPARAQTFVGLSGGWNYVAPVPLSASYSRGWNVQASIGWHVTTNFLWRIDALASQFDITAASQPCPLIGCSGPGYSFRHEVVNGLVANALVNIDSRGLFYLIGGAGLYDVTTQTKAWHFGGSAGAGVAIPVAAHLRAVVEARWHGLVGSTVGPPWLVPVTIGIRY